MKISRTLWTAAAVSAMVFAGCQGTVNEGDTEEAVGEDTLSGDFEAEAEEAGEEIEEGVEQGVEAVGAGTEKLGEEIQESVDEDDHEADTTEY